MIALRVRSLCESTCSKLTSAQSILPLGGPLGVNRLLKCVVTGKCPFLPSDDPQQLLGARWRRDDRTAMGMDPLALPRACGDYARSAVVYLHRGE